MHAGENRFWNANENAYLLKQEDRVLILVKISVRFKQNPSIRGVRELCSSARCTRIDSDYWVAVTWRFSRGNSSNLCADPIWYRTTLFRLSTLSVQKTAFSQNNVTVNVIHTCLTQGALCNLTIRCAWTPIFFNHRSRNTENMLASLLA